jgi:RNA polymerase sigma factor (sigma-70 family)
MKNRIELDVTLLARYAAGDEGAFLELYEHYAPLLQTWAIAIFGVHRDDADDIIQQVFSDFHTRRHETIPYVRGYLHNLLYYRVTDHKRYTLRQRRSPIRETHGYEATIDDNPAEAVEQTEEYRLLRSLVARLPERERNCIEAYMVGRSCRDYASELNTHVNNVKRWTREGLARLREHYSCQSQD